jgi:hypothetical protein
MMENGDRFFAKGSLTNHGMTSADGKAASRNLVSMAITGGTGKFMNLRGIVRAEGEANAATGYNKNHTEIEYWTAK